MFRTLGAAVILAVGAGMATAQDAATPAKPNILVIFGDDIGQRNISIYTKGLMGYRTPNIDRIAKEGIVFTDYYAEQSCTAGRSTFITGQTTLRTGLSKVGLPGADLGLQAERRHHRLGAQGPRLRHRPVRQEPPRRQGRVPADRPRLRRVLRQPLPPERRGGARGPQLSAGPGLPRAVRPARRHQVLRRRHDRGHRPADPQAHGDRRRRDLRRRHRLHEAPARRRHAVLHLDEHHPDARPHPRPRRAPQPAGPDRADRVRRRHDRARRGDRRDPEVARRHGHRRQHHRHLHHRQRPAPEHLARRRHHAVPLREEHQLGRRLPRAGDDPLARPHPSRGRGERHRLRPRLVPDAARRRRRHGHHPAAARRHHDRRQGVQEPPRRLQPAPLPDRRERRERARQLRLPQRRRRHRRASATRTGSSSSRSSA